MVTVPPTLLAEIAARAAATPRREVCGLLLGTPGQIAAALHTANVAADPRTAFEVDPEALLRAMRAERGGGPRLVGCYHSHPHGSATPSPRDAAAAEPGRLWLILAGGEARLWLAGTDGFRPVPLVAAADCVPPDLSPQAGS